MRALILGLFFAVQTVVIGLALAGPDTGAAGSLIETGASHSHFYIEPSYDGTTLVLFGAIHRERLSSGPFEIIVIFRGPAGPLTVWKKNRRAGLFWINAQRMTFEGVPNFYSVLATKPVSEIAPLEVRKANGIGFDALELTPKAGTERDSATIAEFEDALIRLKEGNRLFVKDEQTGLSFFGERLFRARAFLPAAAGPGVYRAASYVIQNGKVVGAAEAKISVKKIGIEARLSTAASDHPWLYGVIAVTLAAAVGGAASFVLRTG